MWDLSVSETRTVAQIQSSYKEIKSPSSRWYGAISSLFLTENSWPLWPGENGNQALRKTEKPFSLAPSSQLWGSWPIVQNRHLLFALNFRSKAVISPMSPPTLLFYIMIFLDRSSPPISLFWGLSLLQPCFRPPCSPCWWSGGISGAAYWWPVACCSGRRDSCIYTSKWQTDFFIKTLSVHRFGGHGGSWQASASLPLEPGPLRGASQSSRAKRPSKMLISLFKTES